MSSSSGSNSGANEHFKEAPLPISPPHSIDYGLVPTTHQSPRISSYTNGPSNSVAPAHSTSDANNTPIETDCCNPMYDHPEQSAYHSACFVDDPHLSRSVSRELSVSTCPSLPCGSTHFSTNFHVKIECDSDDTPPPVHNLSTHPLTANSAPSFHPMVSRQPSVSDQKSDLLSSESYNDATVTDHSLSYATTSMSNILHPPSAYTAYSCLNPGRSVLLHSPLVNPFRPDPYHVPVFGHQTEASSPLPLTSQGHSNTAHLPASVLANSSSHANNLSNALPTTTTFEVNEAHTLLTSMPHFTSDGLLKRVNPNENGLCDNFGPLMDLSSSASGISLGLSPRSKSRRYSYPYDTGNNNAEGASKQAFMKDYAGSSCDRPDQEDQLPPGFRPLPGSLPLGNLPTVTSNGTRNSRCRSNEGLHSAHKLSPLDDEIPLPGFNSPESAFYQYQNRMEGQRCQVCGELAAGFHHGAYVCEACKKFFMRHSLTDTKPTNVCPTGGNCVVAKGSRGKCQICRYRKCLHVGMKMKDPETQPDIDISHIPCRVCGGRSSGFHFGALTCEGCKGFFRRTEGSAGSLVCVGGQNACTITPRSRNACKSCRFRRCMAAGMSKKGSRIGRQPNAVKFHCAIEIRQLRSLRANYTGGLDNSGNQMTGLSSMYGGFSGSDSAGLMMDTPGSTSLHNQSDTETGDTLTPTYHAKREPDNNNNNGSSLWMDEQKPAPPPLSLLVLLPRSSTSMDVPSSCGAASYVSVCDDSMHPQQQGQGQQQHHQRVQQHYSPGYPRSASISRDRSDSDQTALDSSSISVTSRLPCTDGSGHPATSATRSMSDEDEDDAYFGGPGLTVRPLSCQTGPGPHSILYRPTASSSTGNAPPSPSSSSAPDDHNDVMVKVDDLMTTSVTNTTAAGDNTNHNGPSSPVMTSTLIANLAKRLSVEDRGGPDDPEDWMNAPRPSQDAIMRFIEGMRTATEFLRLPNAYFKARFRMTSIPLSSRDSVAQVWNHMMNHFHMHAQQIVQFAKLVPGFNQLGITARSSLVRGGMYPVVMLLLSRDYQVDTDEYNYFDFTTEECNIILHHFPTFSRLTEHLRMAGRLLHHLNLSVPELSLSSAVEILRNYQSLEEPIRSSTKQLYVLANHSLRATVLRRSDVLSGSTTSNDRHRWAQLVALGRMIQAMNQEHHEIISSIKDARYDLHFPELYVEMFQLADSAYALFSASAQAVTLACSSAFQSLAPLKLPTISGCSLQTNNITDRASQSPPPPPTAAPPLTAASLGCKPNDSAAKFLPTGDRWDASRFALAVPAAMAAMAAAVSSQQAPSHLSNTTVPHFRTTPAYAELSHLDSPPMPHHLPPSSSMPNTQLSSPPPPSFLFPTRHQSS